MAEPSGSVKPMALEHALPPVATGDEVADHLVDRQANGPVDHAALAVEEIVADEEQIVLKPNGVRCGHGWDLVEDRATNVAPRGQHTIAVGILDARHAMAVAPLDSSSDNPERLGDVDGGNKFLGIAAEFKSGQVHPSCMFDHPTRVGADRCSDPANVRDRPPGDVDHRRRHPLDRRAEPLFGEVPDAVADERVSPPRQPSACLVPSQSPRPRSSPEETGVR